MASKEFTNNIRIYWEDTDAGGIVYHSNYLNFMERSRTEMLRGLGYGQEELRQQGCAIVIASVNVVFRRPAKLDDLVTVKTVIKTLRRASLIFEQSIWRGEELLCKAEIKGGAIDLKAGVPCPMPEPVYEALKAQMIEE